MAEPCAIPDDPDGEHGERLKSGNPAPFPIPYTFALFLYTHIYLELEIKLCT